MSSGFQQFLFQINQNQDQSEARRYCLLAAKQGNLVAKATLYYKGWSVEKSYLIALKILKEHFASVDGSLAREDSKIGHHMMGYIYQGRESF